MSVVRLVVVACEDPFKKKKQAFHPKFNKHPPVSPQNKISVLGAKSYNYGGLNSKPVGG